MAVAWLEKALLTGIKRRSAICRDLLSREPWDLFFTVFGETHSAGHYFWHLSQDHPLGRGKRAAGDDPLLRVFQAVDRAIGEIMTLRPDADVLLFSPEGIAANAVDLPSTVFLPEFLYRFTFGRPGLADGHFDDIPGPPIKFPQGVGLASGAIRTQSRHTPGAASSATLATDGGLGLVGAMERPRAGTGATHAASARSSINRRCGTARTGPR